MNEKELDDLLDDAAKHWRVPVDPPLDDIWSAVEAEAFAPLSRRRAPGWSAVGIAAAAALVVGVLGGQYLAHRGIVPPVTNTTTGLPPGVQVSALPANDPNQRAMGELLGRTAVLFAAFPADSAGSDSEISREGARLLTTTRLLLDSPVGSDARIHNLLQDLELVLAQVARFDPRHRRDEIQFIQTALDQHDIVPRLRSAAADLSLDDF
jgi:hypothetical protein